MHSTPSTEITAEQAKLFGKYIVGSTPSDELIARYLQMVEPTTMQLSDEDAAAVLFIQKHPRMLGAIDSYAALFRPQSEIRRRLFTMFAVLEATPEYSEEFLPKDRGLLYLLVMAGVSLRLVFRVCLGIVVMGYIGVRK